MEIKERYNNWQERQEIVKRMEVRGLRLLHDDYDPDWKRGDEPRGTLIFTDEMPPPDPVALEWYRMEKRAGKILRKKKERRTPEEMDELLEILAHIILRGGIGWPT